MQKTKNNKYSWDNGSKSNSKPQIVGMIEDFESEYKNNPDVFDKACCAAAVFLFGPIDDKELTIYKQAIKIRVQQYRSSTN